MGRLFKAGTLIVFVFCFLFNQNLDAKTIIVAKTGTATIKSALLQAQNGDTILLKSGVYKEGALIISKSIALIGEGFPIIDGEDKFENLLVEQDNVYISGIVFRNSGSSSFMDVAALKIQNSKNFTVINNRFENNFFGIHCMNSSYGRFENNKLISGEEASKPSANGIHCWKSNHLTIERNTVTGHRDGIYLEFVTHSLIENNKSIKNKRYGLHFMFSHDDTYRNNIIEKNGAGVAVMYSKRVKMYNNTFAFNWGNAAYGLLLKEINDSHIEGNHFSQNTIAIFAESSNRSTIINNDFQKNGWAIQIQASCSDVKVNHNNFIGNTFDVATNGSLVMNTFDGNYWDKYSGYDLNRDGIGDIPHRPVTFYSVIIERNPGALMLFRSFFVALMDKAENAFPNLTPENLKDNQPYMRKLKLNNAKSNN